MYDFAAEVAAREGDRDITEVGRDARMPWEIDGRRWHTVDRVGRTGNPCRWDGRILAEVIDRIQEQSDLFAETDWNSRSVVEIRAAKKSDGWFFHAITGEEWLLKMKFRTAGTRSSARSWSQKLDLKPLNDMPELPLYGTEPRVRCKNLRGPWQEVELRVHSYAEIDRPEFWEFVDRAVAGFAKFTEKVQEKSDILQPWKQLGRKWHFARKGFPLGKKVHWDADVLEDLHGVAGRDRAAGAIPLEQQAGGAGLRARAARALGGRADQEARRGVSAPDGPQGPLHAGTDHRPGLQSRVGRASDRTTT